MKRIIGFLLVLLTVSALCISASAMTCWDALYVNNNILNGSPDKRFNDTLTVNKGDKLYILGWACNENTGSRLKEVVYTVNGGEYVHCGDNYRDRDDIYSDLINYNGELRVHAGVGYDDNAFELTGIDKLRPGRYNISIIALYEDGTSENFGGENEYYCKYGVDPFDRFTLIVEGEPEPDMDIIIDGADGEVEAAPGETAQVRIRLENNPGISSLRAVLNWSDKLILTDARYDIYDESDRASMINTPGTDGSGNVAWEGVSSPYVFNWLTAERIVSGDAVYATLTFRVSEDAQDGEFLYVSAEAEQRDVFSGLNTDVPFGIINGGVTVKDYMIGDVDADGYICNKDVVKLFNAVSSNDYSKIKTRAADVNGDGAINNKDVEALFRMSSSLYR